MNPPSLFDANRLHDAGDWRGAEQAYRAIVAKDPSNVDALDLLGAVLQHTGQFDAGAELLHQAVVRYRAQPPGSEEAWGGYALACERTGLLDEAVAVHREIRRRYPGSRLGEFNFATALLATGHLIEGWQRFESRKPDPPYPTSGRWQPHLRWRGQPVAGKTVLVHAEGGFGDVIQFARYLPILARLGARVIFKAPWLELGRVMQTLPDVTIVPFHHAAPHFDFHCPLLSLPAAFGTTLDTIPSGVPYLRADPAPWAEFLAGHPGLKVGLCWSGTIPTGPPIKTATFGRRSLTFSQMAPLLKIPNCSFVSLQIGPAAERTPLHPIQDFADTAGLIAGLDLVIACDTAVAHLAGALGKPVWILLCEQSCWRWLQGRSDTPWYPTARLFRQRRFGNWDVIADVAEQLTAWATSRTSAALRRPSPCVPSAEVAAEDHASVVRRPAAEGLPPSCRRHARPIAAPPARRRRCFP